MAVDIVNQIRSRLKEHSNPAAFPPTSEAAVKQAELTLGHEIPPILRDVFLTVANGGFGPGYGLIGVEGGYASSLGTLATTHAEIQKGAKYLGLEWKAGMLAFCEWGCNSFSCVDCTDSRFQIVHSEECKTYVQDFTLDAFFKMWLEGVDILSRVVRSPVRTATIINPFTREKFIVRSHGSGERLEDGSDAQA